MEETCCKPFNRKDACNFDYIKPSENAQKRIEAVRAAFKNVENELRAALYSTRETSLVWTHLEQACMWATKGICLDDVSDPAKFNNPVLNETSCCKN